MSSSALSSSSLSYNYTTPPTFTTSMVGYSKSEVKTNSSVVVVLTTTALTPLATITIDKPGVYLVEGTIQYTTSGVALLFTSVSTNTTTLNTNCVVSIASASGIGGAYYVKAIGVFTITAAATSLYALGMSSIANTQVGTVITKFTRLA